MVLNHFYVLLILTLKMSQGPKLSWHCWAAPDFSMSISKNSAARPTIHTLPSLFHPFCLRNRLLEGVLKAFLACVWLPPESFESL